MGIEPDSKDWTWVLTSACPECGANVGEMPVESCAQYLRKLAPQWHAELLQPDVARRPNPHNWSRLEYGAHVRDALAVFAERVELMLTHQAPTFADWDQDAAAENANYAQSNPKRVAAEVFDAIEASAEMLERLDPATHARKGLRSDGAPFTVTSLTQYFAHDVNHHLMDVRRQREG